MKKIALFLFIILFSSCDNKIPSYSFLENTTWKSIETVNGYHKFTIEFKGEKLAYILAYSKGSNGYETERLLIDTFKVTLLKYNGVKLASETSTIYLKYNGNLILEDIDYKGIHYTSVKFYKK